MLSQAASRESDAARNMRNTNSVVRNARRRLPHALVSGLFAFLALSSHTALAFDFVPTELEFMNWSPPVCRAIYAGTEIGRRQSFTRQVPAQEAQQAYRYANVRLKGAWHWCASLVYINRADRAGSEQARKGFISHAVGESRFSWVNCPVSEAICGQFGVTHAIALSKSGDAQAASRVLADVIELYPTLGAGYTSMALLLRDAGRRREAVDVLENGLRLATDNHGELHNFLGHVLADLGRLSEATMHADQADRLGYTLPGLRNRIAAIRDAKVAHGSVRTPKDDTGANSTGIPDGSTVDATDSKQEAEASTSTRHDRSTTVPDADQSGELPPVRSDSPSAGDVETALVPVTALP